MSAASAGRRDRPSGARAARRGLRPVPTWRRRRRLGRRFCWRPPGMVAHRLSGRADSACRVAVGARPRHGGPRRRVGCGKSLGSARGAWRGAGSGSRCLGREDGAGRTRGGRRANGSAKPGSGCEGHTRVHAGPGVLSVQGCARRAGRPELNGRGGRWPR